MIVRLPSASAVFAGSRVPEREPCGARSARCATRASPRPSQAQGRATRPVSNAVGWQSYDQARTHLCQGNRQPCSGTLVHPGRSTAANTDRYGAGLARSIRTSIPGTKPPATMTCRVVDHARHGVIAEGKTAPGLPGSARCGRLASICQNRVESWAGRASRGSESPSGQAVSFPGRETPEASEDASGPAGPPAA